MKLYIKLVLDGLKKNREIYLPYMLSTIFMIFIFSSMMHIYQSPNLDNSYRIIHVRTMLRLGFIILSVFLMIFFNYVDSYVLKRRQKEFGLYNVLGFGRGKIIKLMTIELVFIWFISIVLGIAISVLLYNIMEGLFLKSIVGEYKARYIPSIQSILMVFIVFLAMAFILLVNRIMKISRYSNIELINKDEVLGKISPLKVASSLIGFVLILIGYYLANIIQNPFDSIVIFLFCVILVIIGTFLALSGIVEVILRLLKKNKSFYYNKKHFTAIGGLISRIRANANGLSGIAIMSCAAIVLLYCAVGLRFGIIDTLNTQYPRDIKMIYLGCDAKIHEKIDRKIASLNATDEYSFKMLFTTAKVEDKTLLKMDESVENFYSLSQKGGFMVRFLAKDSFDELKDYNLKEGEVIYFTRHEMEIEEINFNESAYRVKDRIADFKNEAFLNLGMVDEVYVFMDDLEDFIDKNFESENMKVICIRNFNVEHYDKGVLVRELRESLGESRIYYRDDEIKDVLSIHGGMFFIGIFLGLAFFVGTALVIYYKQVSEAYEDRGRYTIYRNVGMNEQEIKISIKSQIQTLFMLPVATCLIHLLFAYHIINIILRGLGIYNEQLKIMVFATVFVIYLIIYFLIYRLTSSAYYNIISKSRE